MTLFLLRDISLNYGKAHENPISRGTGITYNSCNPVSTDGHASHCAQDVNENCCVTVLRYLNVLPLSVFFLFSYRTSFFLRPIVPSPAFSLDFHVILVDTSLLGNSRRIVEISFLICTTYFA